MKEKLENILYEYLKTNLPSELSKILIKGHTTNDRRIPYIYIDVGEIKPFGDLEVKDGMFEATVNIAVADSAHDIDYKQHFKRTRGIVDILENFSCETDEIVVNGIYLENDTDARDDNNIGSVLSYKVIVQYL